MTPVPAEQTIQYEQVLDSSATMVVRYRLHASQLADYSVVLISGTAGSARSVRIYDYAHGCHDEHRCTRAGQRGPATIWHHGSIQEGFEAAQRLIRSKYVTMIEAWLRQP